MGLRILAALVVIGASAMADEMLFDFAEGFDPAAVPARDAAVEVMEDGELLVRTGANQPWPGVTLDLIDAPRDLSGFLEIRMPVRNAGETPVVVHCRVDNVGANGVDYCFTESCAVRVGETAQFRIALPGGRPTDENGDPIEFFGMRAGPGGSGRGTFDPTKVVALTIFVAQPSEPHAFALGAIEVAGERTGTDWPTPFFPMIDTFGQYMHKDWPGKTHFIEQLGEALEAELADIEANPGPADWNQYGGWAAGPQLQATGFFRVQKVEGKWWLVDPEGRLFFSHGTDCVNPWEGNTPIDDREHWYADLPPEGSELAECYGRGRGLHGYYAGREVRTYDFGRANLMRKYGADWYDSFADLSHRRLRSWGMNTIANWSDERIYRMGRTPYTRTLGTGGPWIEGSEGYWSKFHDVFDPGFEQAVRENVQRGTADTADDSWCIGYFVDNEIPWGDEMSLAIGALQSPPGQAAKQAFVSDLREQYGGIDDLNQAWGTAHESWDALLESREPPDRDAAAEDLRAFSARIAEGYFRTIRDAIREFAPNQLYLGCRFAWVNHVAAEVAAEYCDVVSFNLYRRSVEGFPYPGGHDVPMIIGEFHFGALDRGMFHTGLVAVKDQDERADTYRDYVRGVMAHPQFVGCHWFKYIDESTTGRPLDEENYQIGFVDIVDTPYPEIVRASRDVGYALYEFRRNADAQ